MGVTHDYLVIREESRLGQAGGIPLAFRQRFMQVTQPQFARPAQC